MKIIIAGGLAALLAVGSIAVADQSASAASVSVRIGPSHKHWHRGHWYYHGHYWGHREYRCHTWRNHGRKHRMCDWRYW
jgi:hypothetical protein